MVIRSTSMRRSGATGLSKAGVFDLFASEAYGWLAGCLVLAASYLATDGFYPRLTTSLPHLVIAGWMVAFIVLVLIRRTKLTRSVFSVGLIGAVGSVTLVAYGNPSSSSELGSVLLTGAYVLVGFMFLETEVAVMVTVAASVLSAASTFFAYRSNQPLRLFVLELVAFVVIGTLATRVVSKLSSYALIDPLTALPNRRYLENTLAHQIESCHESGDRLVVGILDLDNFKGLNDRAGHLAGDYVLSNISNRWKRSLRTADFLARVGGDEFVVVLPGASDEVAIRILERLGSITVSGVSASYGYAIWDGSEDLSSFLHRCDRELYRSKEAKIPLGSSNVSAELMRRLKHMESEAGSRYPANSDTSYVDLAEF